MAHCIAAAWRRAAVAAARVDNPAATTRDLGIYLNDHLSIERWRLALGLRRDAVSTDNGRSKQDDQATSFGAGVLYESDLGLSPYVSYAESFEPVVGVDNITGAALKPRQGEQLEYGIKYAAQNGRLFVTLAAFDIETRMVASRSGRLRPGCPGALKAYYRGCAAAAVCATRYAIGTPP